MSLRISHNGIVMRAECADELNGVLQNLFDLMVQHMDRGAQLRSGIKVNFGWSELQVEIVNGDFVFREPDFDNDPDREYRENVDFSLSGYRRQKWLVDTLGIGRWDPARFSDTVIAEKGVLAVSRVVAKRVADQDKRSSWLVCLEKTAKRKKDISVEQLNSSFEQVPVWHLHDIRPALFDALALPVGYHVLIDDNRILQVVSDDGQHWSL
ncbi:MAG: immunity protein Imm33 domain-containing protein [Fimbriiglobus sp.]